MREIYIDIYQGSYHPCEVNSLKYNRKTNQYHLFFLDRSMNEYYTAILEKDADQFGVISISCERENKSLEGEEYMEESRNSLPCYLAKKTTK